MNRVKLIILGLVISVAINLVFIGGIGYRASNLRDFGPRPFPPNVGWVVRDLGEERRQELRPLLEQSYEEIRPMRREMSTAQRRVNELMASQSFDAEALNQAFAELRDLSERYQALSHQQTITILNELSEEERRMAMEFIQRRGPREGMDRFRGRSGGPGFGPGGRPGRPSFPLPSPPGDPDQ